MGCFESGQRNESERLNFDICNGRLGSGRNFVKTGWLLLSGGLIFLLEQFQEFQIQNASCSVAQNTRLLPFE
jgi:hypothetical protein